MPAALGEFKAGPTLIDRVCKQCNECNIGVLDEQFVRCGPVAVLRKRFNIQGRQHHDKVNSFYRGSAGGQRIKFLAWDDAFQCEVLIEMLGGNEGRQLTQLIVKGTSGSHHHIPLTPSLTPEVLRKQVAGLQLEAPLEVRLVHDPATEQWAVALFRALWPDQQLPSATSGATGFNGGLVEFQTTNRYFRAVAKIGFHYFLTQFPWFTGPETLFDDIKQFIIDDTKEFKPQHINSFVGVHQFPIAPPSNGFVGHLLCAEINSAECTAHIELFVAQGGRMPAYKVCLGRTSVVKSSALRSNLYLYYGAGKQGRFSGEVVKVDDLLIESRVLQDNPTGDAVSPAPRDKLDGA